MNYFVKYFFLNTIIFTSLVANIKPDSKIVNNDNHGQLYVLGDSFSDNGNLTHIFDSYVYDTVDIHFAAPFYHDSFTNGDVAAKVLANDLGLDLKTAWFNGDGSKGNNYAVGGATTLMNDREPWWSPFHWYSKWLMDHYCLEHQAEQMIADHKNEITSADKVLLEGGGNDIMTDAAAFDEAGAKAVLLTAVDNEMAAVNTLLAGGIKNIVIGNSPDFAIIPYYHDQDQTTRDLITRLCVYYNQVLDSRIKTLNATLAQDTHVLQYNLFDEFHNLVNQGIAMNKNVTTASITYWKVFLFTGTKPWFNDNLTPETMNSHFFFDFIHPNQWVHKLLGEDLYHFFQKNFNL